jgi:hypothetical protein
MLQPPHAAMCRGAASGRPHLLKKAFGLALLCFEAIFLCSAKLGNQVLNAAGGYDRVGAGFMGSGSWIQGAY